MIFIIRLFGILGIIISVVLALISLANVFLMATLLPAAASLLLGGVLLMAFARVVELLEELNMKIEPLHTIAKALEPKYRPVVSAQSYGDLSNQADAFGALPPGSQIERHFKRRVAFLPDDSVIGETDSGPRHFPSFEKWREFIGA